MARTTGRICAACGGPKSYYSITCAACRDWNKQPNGKPGNRAEWSRQVTELTARGLPKLQIAAELGISAAYVKMLQYDPEGTLPRKRYEKRRPSRFAADRSYPGVTYVVQAGTDGPVKIGRTTRDLRERIKALQIGSPLPLRVVKVLQGIHREQLLHSRFAHLRLNGEWFDPHVLTLIEDE